MSISGARMRMDMALKDLRIRWYQVREHWDDPVSRAFEAHHLDPLDDAVRIAGAALDKMREVVDRARRECDDAP